MNTSNPLLPALALVGNAFIFGLSWWPFRVLQEQGLNPLWATVVAYALGLAWLSLLRPGVWRELAQTPALWPLLLASGLANVGFNWAVATGDVLRVVLLFYLMPAWSLLLAWPLLGEVPRPAALVRLVLALLGVLLVLGDGAGVWPVPHSRADWLALAGGFFFALTNVWLRRAQHAPQGARMLAMFAGSAGLAALAALLAQGLGMTEPLHYRTAWLLPALGLGLAMLVGNLALQYGAARLPAATTALIMLTEVVFASVSSVAAGAAVLTARVALGGGFIVLAAVLAALPERAPRTAVARQGGLP